MQHLQHEQEQWMRHADQLDLRVANMAIALRPHLDAAWPYFKLREKLKCHLDVRPIPDF